MRESPIWDDTYGFGGNGNLDVGEVIVGGHCVTNGPFANSTIPYLDDEYHPHCLSRGFESGPELRGNGSWFSPSALERLLHMEDYESFNLGLEHGPHIAIPRSVRGDFSLLTAPSDPVFFLHHTQLDRIWWKWQQMDSSRHFQQYTGKAKHNSTESASLDDILPLDGLARAAKVSEIISTESGLLCYRY